MRSRYSAFAKGLGEYLVETLSSDHEDRAVPREALVQELSRAKDRQRFLGLRILDTSSEGDAGEVTFIARIFERGTDRSFGERSAFLREEGTWRYASGKTLFRDRLPAELDTVTSEDFTGLLRKG